MTSTFARPSLRARAFSLLEIVIAFGVLVFALLAVMAFVSSAGAAQRLLSEQELARGLAYGKLAELQASLHDPAWTTPVGREEAFLRILTDLGGSSAGKATLVLADTVIRGQAADHADAARGTTGAVVGTLTVEAWTQESLVQAATGLVDVDINANKAFDEATDVPAGEIAILPVRVTVTWKTTGNTEVSESVLGLLY